MNSGNIITSAVWDLDIWIATDGWPFASKKLLFDLLSIVTFAISEILIWFQLSSREIIIFIKSSGVVHWRFIVIGNFIIFGTNSSCWIFYIFDSYCLFYISKGDIMDSQLSSIEPYTHRFLLVPWDIHRCNTLQHREFI